MPEIALAIQRVLYLAADTVPRWTDAVVIALIGGVLALLILTSPSKSAR